MSNSHYIAINGMSGINSQKVKGCKGIIFKLIKAIRKRVFLYGF